MNIIKTTLEYNFCIGCGICASVCPTKAITMKWSSEYYNMPYINNEKCLDCGLCSKYCTRSKEVLDQMNHRVASEDNYNLFGLNDISIGYLSWSKCPKRKLSSSGGVATELAKALLKNGLIGAVLHACPHIGKFNEPPYIGVVSKTSEDIDSRRGSFYYAIDFSDALEEIKKQITKSLLVIGTPCITSSMKKYIEKCLRIKCYTLALACSHNVNGMLASYMAESFGITHDKKWIINFRDKGGEEGIENATNFNTAFYNECGDILARENRFKSHWTTLWRNYAFSMNCCNSCSDFWGADADVSVKDAWYKWSKDSESKSIILFRNNQLLNIFESLDLYREYLDLDTIVKCQEATVKYKQGSARKRINSSVKNWNSIDFRHIIYSCVSSKSKQIYSEKGYSSDIYKICFYAQRVIANNPVSLIKRAYRKAKMLLKKGLNNENSCVNSN